MEKPLGSSSTSPLATAAPSEMDTDTTYKNGYSVMATANSTSTHMITSSSLSPGLWDRKELGLDAAFIVIVLPS